MRRKRTWIIIGVAVVLVGVGVVVATNSQRSAAQAAQTTVQTGRVTESTLLLTVDSSGSVSPESTVTLSFGTSGTVDKVNVRPGDRVKQGDVLAELDTRDLALQVAQQKYASSATDQVTISCNNVDNALQSYNDAQTAYDAYIANWRVQVNGTADISPQKARLASAKLAYDQAVANCDLAKSGVNNSGVQSAFAQLEQAKTDLKSLLQPSDHTLALAKLQLDQAKLALDQARQQLDKAQIIAPFDGAVTQVTALLGGPSSGTIVLVDDSHYHVGLLIDETQIGEVKTGQAVEFTFDALPTTTVTGTVTLINPAGTVSQGVVNYLVRADLNPTKAPLKIDMTANGRVVLDTHRNVLAVPGAAIRTEPNGGYYVNVLDTATGEPVRVDVTTGYTDGGLTEVSGDLQPGDRVFLSEPPARQQQGGVFGAIRLGR
jgi:HlyD family secretion protein